MTTPEERQRALTDILEQRVLVLDGAMGTMLQQRTLTAEDFGGSALEGCNEMLLRHRPDEVLDIHRAYYHLDLQFFAIFWHGYRNFRRHSSRCPGIWSIR